MREAVIGPMRDALDPETRVEVRSRFDGAWKRGFAVDSVLDGGYLLRRLSDGSVLPVAFAFDEVRRERERVGWR